MTQPWNKIPKRRSRRGNLHQYVFTTKKKIDPARLLAEMVESAGSVHSIELERGRLTVKVTMPCNEVDRTALKTALRKHRAKDSR